MAAFLIGMAMVAFSNHDFVSPLLDRVMLLRRPERFTELYFTDHLHLPKRTESGGQLRFSFAIHNLEGEDRVYHSIVTLEDSAGAESDISEQAVLVRDTETKSVEMAFRVPESFKSGNVIVGLSGSDQRIRYLINSND